MDRSYNARVPGNLVRWQRYEWTMKEIGRGRWSVAVTAAALLLLLLTACASDEDGAPKESGVADQIGSGRPAVTSDRLDTTAIPSDSAPGAPSAIPTLIPPTAVPTATIPPAPLAAVVNGRHILLDDYERRLAYHEQALLAQGLDPASEAGLAELEQLRHEVLEGLIDSVLIEQGSAALGVTLSDEELEGQLEGDIVAGGGPADFEEWLRATGQTRDDYKEMLRESMLAERVLERVAVDLSGEAESPQAQLELELEAFWLWLDEARSQAKIERLVAE